MKRGNGLFQFESSVAGIPCIVDVTYYAKGHNGSRDEPPDYGEVEYDILDRKGYPAAWLAKKLMEQDAERIEVAAHEYVREQNAEARADARMESRMSRDFY